jgi:peptidase E
MIERRILATCGGWSPARWGDVEFSPLQRYALELTGVTGRRIRVAFVNTASGDQRVDEGRELAAAAQRSVDAVHVRLFGRNQPDLREAVLTSDLVWVGGGSVANLLAVWRVHGLDRVMREAWEAGVLLAGTSAGALCWHVGGPTSTFGEVSVIDDALALVPHSLGVHYDSQPERRPSLHRAVADRRLPAGFGLDEGTGILYSGTEAIEFVTELPGTAVHHVERGAAGIVEHRLETRSLK